MYISDVYCVWVCVRVRVCVCDMFLLSRMMYGNIKTPDLLLYKSYQNLVHSFMCLSAYVL